MCGGERVAVGHGGDDPAEEIGAIGLAGDAAGHAEGEGLVGGGDFRAEALEIDALVFLIICVDDLGEFDPVVAGPGGERRIPDRRRLGPGSGNGRPGNGGVLPVLEGESAERTREGTCAGGGHEERMGAVAGWRVHAMEGDDGAGRGFGNC